MTIHCYATIEEFKSAVASVDPRAVNSPGFYNTNTAVSYFFKRDGYLTTVLHECTHQVMHRVASSSPGVTARPQFWLFEGLASCFETYEGPGSRPTFFRTSTPKLEGLRKMAASGSGVLPLLEFTALAQEGFMGKQDRYFQAMGLVHFLLEGDGGSCRPAVPGVRTEGRGGRGDRDVLHGRLRRRRKAALDGWLAFGR